MKILMGLCAILSAVFLFSCFWAFLVRWWDGDINDDDYT